MLKKRLGQGGENFLVRAGLYAFSNHSLLAAK